METVRQTLIDRKVKTKVAFDDTTLSSPYQNSETIAVCGASKGALAVEYERGMEELSSVAILRIEFSHDGTNWFQEASSTSQHDLVTHTLDPGGSQTRKLTIQFDIPPVGYMRISAKETGVSIEYGKITVIASWMP